MKAVWKRETQGYFYTPVGYVFLGVFLTISSLMFYMSILQQRSGELPVFIGEMNYLWMLLSPVLTMRLLAEERQKKTDQLLLTSPVSLPGIVVGKYLAAVTVLLIAAGATLLYVLIVGIYGQVYPAELAVNYLGFILLGCAFAALDLFLSGCAATPVTAAVLAFGANFMLWILDLLETAVQVPWISAVLRFLSLYSRNEPLMMGQLSAAGVLYDLSFIAVFLALTVYRLDRRRIGGRTPLPRRKRETAGDTGTRDRKDRRKYSGVSALLLALVIASLAALNVGADALETKYGWRGDYSFNHISTHSEATEELLAGVTHDVHIWALFRKGDEDTSLTELLNRYAARSSHITWEQADPGLSPALVNRFSAGSRVPEENGLIVWCEDTGRWKLLGPEDYVSLSMNLETGEFDYAGWTYERSITRAIDYVTRERIPRITVIQGHGELDGETLEAFDRLMTSNGYEVTYERLSDAAYTPDPQDLLVFFSPQRDLTETEAEKLTAFARQGGSFLFTRDFSDPDTGMDRYMTLLRSYGFICRSGIVIADEADENSLYSGNPVYLLPEMVSTDITMDLIASGADQLLLPGGAAFMDPGETDNGLIVSVVLRSGATSFLKQLNAAGSVTIDREDGDEQGPFPLALQARRIYAERDISRAFIIGCSAAVTDEQVLNMTDAPQLLIRTAEFLLGMEASNLNIMARDAVRPSLGVGSVRTGSILLTALPAAVLLCALLVLPRRRNR